MGDLPQYVVGTVPDTLFTRNELNQLGKVPIDPNEVAGFVVYPDQNREFKLYHIDKTREPKKQKTDGIIPTAVVSRSVTEILEKRKEYAVHGTRGILKCIPNYLIHSLVLKSYFLVIPLQKDI